MRSKRIRLHKTLPVVCVGGSAGGLDAYIRFTHTSAGRYGGCYRHREHLTIMPTSSRFFPAIQTMRLS